MSSINKSFFAPDHKRKVARLEAKISDVLSSYGYLELILPIYEYYEILKETTKDFRDETIVRFIDRNTGKSVVLRPDFTPQACRSVSNYMSGYPLPIRVSYRGRVFRNVVIDTGLKAERYQIGCELIGASERDGDIEMLLMASRILKSLKLSNCSIAISDVSILDEIAAIIPEHSGKYFEFLRAKNIDAIAKFCKKHNFNTDIEPLLKYLPMAFGGLDVFDKLLGLSRFSKSLHSRLEYLQTLFTKLANFGINGDLVLFDASSGNNQNYYTGIHFEIIHKQLGRTLGGGGRYDNLMEKFGADLPACGLMFHIEELLHAGDFKLEKERYDYLVVGIDKHTEAENLRDQGNKVLHIYDKGMIDLFKERYIIDNIIS